MIWQDIAIAFANILFGYSLINQVYYGFKKKKTTITIICSSLTALGLYIIAISLFTLNLYISSIVSFITGTLWLVLFIQRIIYKKN
jgi:hypothetical protein